MGLGDFLNHFLAGLIGAGAQAGRGQGAIEAPPSDEWTSPPPPPFSGMGAGSIGPLPNALNPGGLRYQTPLAPMFPSAWQTPQPQPPLGSRDPLAWYQYRADLDAWQRANTQ